MLWTAEEDIHEIRGKDPPMAKEPMSQNQKFALLVFTLVLIVGVALVWIYITSGINAM